MILRFLRQGLRQGASRRRAIEGLHLRIDRAAREPGLYRDLGVPDTVEGRFEAVNLHVYLVLRRLRALPPPAEDVAQDLVDAVFRQLDASLRELGVGDLGVGKRMKRLASAFYGRAGGYDAALDSRDRTALAAVLARNVLGRDSTEAAAGQAGSLADYVLATEAALRPLTLDELLQVGPPFPVPGRLSTERTTP